MPDLADHAKAIMDWWIEPRRPVPASVDDSTVILSLGVEEPMRVTDAVVQARSARCNVQVLFCVIGDSDAAYLIKYTESVTLLQYYSSVFMRFNNQALLVELRDLPSCIQGDTTGP